MEQLLYLFVIIWVIGAVLVFCDIRQQKKHPPKAPNNNYTKYLDT